MILAYISLALSIYAIVRKSWKFMVVSAALYLPLLLYLNLLPRFEGWILFILLFYALTSYFLWLKNYLLSWISLVPIGAFTIWLFLVDLAIV